MEKFRSTSVAGLSEYCSAIGEGFCPFLQPAQKERVLYFSAYYLRGEEIRVLQEDIFYAGVLHTELLRKERARQSTIRAKTLICENLVFYLENHTGNAYGAELFAWPHWFLKLLYTEVGVLFGKFWQGERDYTRDGRSIPIPPQHLLSIRSAVKPVDSRFFLKAPELTMEYHLSSDNGQNVLSQIMNSRTREIINRVQEFPLQDVSQEVFQSLMQEMKNVSFYADVVEWSMYKEHTLGIQTQNQDDVS